MSIQRTDPQDQVPRAGLDFERLSLVRAGARVELLAGLRSRRRYRHPLNNFR
jgi:hypothetical protein